MQTSLNHHRCWSLRTLFVLELLLRAFSGHAQLGERWHPLPSFNRYTRMQSNLFNLLRAGTLLGRNQGEIRLQVGLRSYYSSEARLQAQVVSSAHTRRLALVPPRGSVWCASLTKQTSTALRPFPPLSLRLQPCRLSLCASCSCKRLVSWQRLGLQLSLCTIA